MGKVRTYPSGALTGLQFQGRLLVVIANIRLGSKWLAVTNTLVYYDTESITVGKSFRLQALGYILFAKVWS